MMGEENERCPRCGSPVQERYSNGRIDFTCGTVICTDHKPMWSFTCEIKYLRARIKELEGRHDAST